MRSALKDLWRIWLGLILGCVFVTPIAAQEVAVQFWVDVPVAERGGEILLEGAPVPGYDNGGLATLGLRSEHGYETDIAGTLAGDYGPMLLIEDDYVSIYRLDFSTGGLPLNGQANFGPTVSVTTDETIDLDVPEQAHRFDIRLNGAPFPSASNNVAEIRLQHVGSGDEFPIGIAGTGVFEFRLIPGRYDVIYAHISGDTIPQNTHAVVLQNVDLRVMRRPIVVDIEMYSQMIVPTLNGGDFPSSGYEAGRIQLHNFQTGDSVEFGRTHLGPSSRWIIPGVYDAAFSRTLGGSQVPRNGLGVVAKEILFEPEADPRDLAVDVVDVGMVEMTPVLTLNGAPFPESGYESARIYFVSSTGEEIYIGRTHELDEPVVRLVPGLYDVVYRRTLGGSLVPRNNNARIAENLLIESDGTVAIDVEMVEVTFEYRLDGEAFPVGDYQRANFYLASEFGGELDLISLSNIELPMRRLIRGTYDVVYDHVLGGEIIPRNKNQIIMHDVVLETNQILKVPVESRVVIADFSMNGEDFPTDPDHSGDFFLRDPSGGELRLGPSHTGDHLSVNAIEAAYHIEYEWRAGDQVPQNARHRLGQVAVPEPSFGLALAFGICFLARKERRRPASKK